MKCNIAAVAVLSTALVAASVSTASARDHHWHHGHGFGPFALVGAAVVGVATIATLPFRALADAASGPRRDDGYDRGPRDDYNDADYSQQAPRGYYDDQSYQNRRAYADRGENYQQPPPGYYPPPNYPPPNPYAQQQNYGSQSYGYGPPPGYGGPPPGY